MSNVTDKKAGNPEVLASFLDQAGAINILQIGLCTEAEQETLIQAINRTENASRSIITISSKAIESGEEAMIDHLKHRARKEEIEIIETEAVKALPDFYFQNQRFDFAVIHTSGSALQALVAFYYVDQILKTGGNLVINLQNQPAMLKLARHVATETRYNNLNHPNSNTALSRIRNLARTRLSQLPSFFRRHFDTVVHPDLLLTDSDLGLGSSFARFVKNMAEMPTGDSIDYEEQLNMDFDTLLDSIMSEKS